MTAPGATEAYDVFLSYNRKDVTAIRALCAELEARKLSVFMDEDHPDSGGWFHKIDLALGRSATCAVLVGPSGIGGAQKMEVDLAQKQRADTRGKFGLFTVVIPGTSASDASTIIAEASRFLDLVDRIFLESLSGPAARHGIDSFVAMVRGELRPSPPPPDPGRPALPNPWISEFAVVRRRLAPSLLFWMPHVLAGGLALWAGLTLIAAWFADADRLQVDLGIFGPSGSLKDSATVRFGYFVELNHFWFHCIGVPLFAYLAATFVSAAGDAVEILTAGRSPILRAGTRARLGSWAVTLLARRNLVVSRWVLPIAAVLAVGAIVGAEYASFGWKRLGWVQAPFFASEWLAQQHDGTPIQIFDLGPGGKPVARTKDTLSMPTSVDTAIERIHEADPSAAPLDVRFTAVKTRCGPEQTPHPWVGIVFLGLAFGNQWVFYTMVLWVVAKIALVFVSLLGALGNSAGPDLEVGPRRRRRVMWARLNFDDEDRRFGLGSFDRVYDLAVALAIVGAIGIALRIANRAKDGAIRPPVEMATHVVAAVGLCVVVAAVILIPWLLFGHLLRGKRVATLRMLEEQKQYAHSDEERMTIAKRIDRCSDQIAWPANDWRFIVLMMILVSAPVVLWFNLSHTIAGATTAKFLSGC